MSSAKRMRERPFIGVGVLSQQNKSFEQALLDGIYPGTYNGQTGVTLERTALGCIVLVIHLTSHLTML